MTEMRRKRATNELPPIGAKVRMRFGTADVTATVIEHRGPLGGNGAEMIRVRFEFGGADEPMETEVTLDEVTLVGSAA